MPLRFSPFFPPPIGGGTASVNVPTEPDITYKSTNFGCLTDAVSITSGNGSLGSPVSLMQQSGGNPVGLDEDIDGFILQTNLLNRDYQFSIFVDDGTTVTERVVRVGGRSRHWYLPLKCFAGEKLTIKAATVGALTFAVNAQPFKSSVPSTIRKIEALGSIATANSNGVSLTVGGSAVSFPALTKNILGLIGFSSGIGGDGARSNSDKPVFIDVYADGVLAIPNFMVQWSANAVDSGDSRRVRKAYSSGVVFSAAARWSATVGTTDVSGFVDPVSFQLCTCSVS